MNKKLLLSFVLMTIAFSVTVAEARASCSVSGYSGITVYKQSVETDSANWHGETTIAPGGYVSSWGTASMDQDGNLTMSARLEFFKMLEFADVDLDPTFLHFIKIEDGTVKEVNQYAECNPEKGFAVLQLNASEISGNFGLMNSLDSPGFMANMEMEVWNNEEIWNASVANFYDIAQDCAMEFAINSSANEP